MARFRFKFRRRVGRAYGRKRFKLKRRTKAQRKVYVSRGGIRL